MQNLSQKHGGETAFSLELGDESSLITTRREDFVALAFHVVAKSICEEHSFEGLRLRQPSPWNLFAEIIYE
jgi:hypothetical protein